MKGFLSERTASRLVCLNILPIHIFRIEFRCVTKRRPLKDFHFNIQACCQLDWQDLFIKIA